MISRTLRPGAGGSARRNSQHKKPKQLTAKERKLLKGVLQGKSRAQAARDAGYSAHSAKQVAYRVFTKAYFRERIDRILEQLDVSAEEVVKTLAFQMRGDITDLYDEKGQLDLATIRARGLGQLIKRVRTKR